MSDRYTRAIVQNSFRYFLSVIGAKETQHYSEIGSYALNYAAAYGGYQIVKIVNESGGVDCPFGHGRMSGRDMVQAINFAIRTIEEIERKEH